MADSTLTTRTTKERIIDLCRCCAAEFFTVAYFVYVGSLAATGKGLGGGVLTVATGHGLAIALLVAATGRVSGGHVNPAVTLGAVLAGALHPINGAFYVLAQLLGACIGSLAVYGSVDDNAFTAILGGLTMPNLDVCTWAQALLMESVLTFGLVFAVLNTAVDRNGHTVAPLAIGFAVFVGICAGGNVSGASMNPARSFGPAVVSAILGREYRNVDSVFAYHYIYWAGPALGAAAAAVLYKLALASRGQRWVGN